MLFPTLIYTAENQWIRRELSFRYVTPSTFQVGMISEEPTAPNALGSSYSTQCDRLLNKCTGFNRISTQKKQTQRLPAHSSKAGSKKERIKTSLCFKETKTIERKCSQLKGNSGCPSARVWPRQRTHLLTVRVSLFFFFPLSGNLLTSKYGMTFFFSLGDKWALVLKKRYIWQEVENRKMKCIFH